MAVNFPNELTVECDGCGETIEAVVSEYAGEPASIGVDDETLEAEG